MSYSKPEQMSDQEFYISVEQVYANIPKSGQIAMTEKLCYKGSDSCFAMQSPISASSHPLLVLRQQQLASTGISLVIFFHVFVNILLIALMDLQVSYSPRVHSVAHMLLVTEAQGGDAGQYRCTARNEVFFLLV